MVALVTGGGRGIGQAMCTGMFCKDVPVEDITERQIDLYIKH